MRLYATRYHLTKKDEDDDTDDDDDEEQLSVSSRSVTFFLSS